MDGASGGETGVTGGSTGSGGLVNNQGTGGAAEDACADSGFDLDDLESSVGSYTEIEGGFRIIRGVESDGTDVYAIADTGLFRIAGGETVATLLTEEVGDVGVTYGKGRLAVADDFIYLASPKGASRVPLAGGPAELFFEGMPEGAATTSIQVYEDSLYVGSRAPTYIYRVPLDGSEPTQLLGADILSLEEFFVAQGQVFVSDFSSGVVQSFPIEGGAPSPAVPTERSGWVVGLTVVGDELYWVDRTTLKVTIISEPTNVTTVGEALERNIEVVGDRVYSIEESVEWISTDGSSCGIVARGDFPNDAHDYAIAGGYAFVTDGDALFRIPLD